MQLKSLISIAILWCFVQHNSAQQIIIYNKPISISEAHATAVNYLHSLNYEDALFYFLEMERFGYANPYIKYRIGECMMHTPDKREQAYQYLTDACQQLSDEFETAKYSSIAPLRTMYLLANWYRLNQEFSKAEKVYLELYTKLTQDLKEHDTQKDILTELKLCKTAGQLIQNPVPATIENIGQPINNKYDNYNPVISDDEKDIFYMNKFAFYDAIMQSNLYGHSWENTKNITTKIKSDGQFKVVGLSSDKCLLLLSGYNESTNSIDLYESIFKKGKWSTPVPLNTLINTPFDEVHACLTADNSKLYFTSNRPDGMGGFDIYVSKRDRYGDWDKPRNLGAPVNTNLDDNTPAITKDGYFLFFSSKGHMGIGGYDIFYCNKLMNEKWSNPINLGYPINSTDDNVFFTPVNNGKAGYYSVSKPDGYGKHDIVRVDLPNLKQPMTYNFNVKLDNESKNFIDSMEITFINNFFTDTLKLKAFEDKENVDFNTKLKTNIYEVDIEIYEKAEVSIKEETNFLTHLSNESFQNINQYLKENHIYFNLNSSQLTSAELKKVEEISSYLAKNKQLKVELTGHTDRTGNYNSNLVLSEKRAVEVKQKLMTMGVDEKRILISAAGESKIFAKDINTDGTINQFGAKLNRRVELRLIY